MGMETSKHFINIIAVCGDLYWFVARGMTGKLLF